MRRTDQSHVDEGFSGYTQTRSAVPSKPSEEASMIRNGETIQFMHSVARRNTLHGAVRRALYPTRPWLAAGVMLAGGFLFFRNTWSFVGSAWNRASEEARGRRAPGGTR